MTKLYYLVEGRAKLFTTLKNGRVNLFNFYEVPSFLGDMELIDPDSYTKGVRAHTRCYCIALDLTRCGERVLEMCIRDRCKDSFYGQHSPERMPVSYELENKWQAWIRGGALGSEMETSALYTVSQVLGVRAGAVMLCVWNQEREKAGLDQQECHDTTGAIRTAIRAVEILAGK